MVLICLGGACAQVRSEPTNFELDTVAAKNNGTPGTGA